KEVLFSSNRFPPVGASYQFTCISAGTRTVNGLLSLTQVATSPMLKGGSGWATISTLKTSDRVLQRGLSRLMASSASFTRKKVVFVSRGEVKVALVSLGTSDQLIPLGQSCH